MTDANGFYRPRDLPQDIEFEDTDDDDSKHPLESATESETASVYTSYSRPSSSASYLFPGLNVGRRTPVSMADYNYRSNFMPPPPETTFTPPPPSQYTPQYTPTASVYTPPPSHYNPPSSSASSERAPQYTPQASNFPSPSHYTQQSSSTGSPDLHSVPVIPSIQSMPPIPQMGQIGQIPQIIQIPEVPHHPTSCRYGTTHLHLPFHVHDPSFPSKRGCCGSRLSITARRVLLRITLATFLCIILWHSYYLFEPYTYRPARQLPSFCSQSGKTPFASHGAHTLHLPSSSFSLEAADVGLAGNILVRSDPDAENVTFEYDIVSSAPDTVSFTVNRSGAVELRVSHSHECVTAQITITLPSRLQKLSLVTTTLPIELSDSISLSHLQITTRHGNVLSHASVKASTSIVLKSGSISGTFDLGDKLELETLSGAIAARIHPLNLTTPNAVLIARTMTGSIALSLALDDETPPKRNYTSTVSTASGAIEGTFLLGAVAKFAATAGAINANLLPVLFDEKPGRLVTEAKHGATMVRFARELKGKRVLAQHGAVTGAVNVRYPKDWEGEVKALARVGNVRVIGDGVEITKREWGLVEGFKGDKKSGSILARSDVGGVTVRVG